MRQQIDPCFTYFNEDISCFSVPKKFNFPFYYTADPLCVLAAKELQLHLKNQTNWNHNFGIDEEQTGLIIGKMFGVLIVENKQGEIGYLAAFSGKLAGENHHPKFVPPVFDILVKDGFFRKGEAIVSAINNTIEQLENTEEFITTKEALFTEKSKAQEAIETKRKELKIAKEIRRTKRLNAKETLSEEAFTLLLDELGKESVSAHYSLKDLVSYWNKRISSVEEKFARLTTKIDALKEERKIRSAAIQQQIFENYTFLNGKLETKDLKEIFAPVDGENPPAGAGECSAPKLLQYAFLNGLKPLSIAEFWWGKSPSGEIRKHGHFYPACRSKCEPILNHMLEGIEVEENPMLTNPALGKEITILFEDEYIVAIDKPAEFLSVPGITIQDSVYDRMKLKYPKANGPLVVHRLDMSTSGIMLIALDKVTHKNLQRQFINRTIEKNYIAILDGVLDANEGTIDLPLRVDLDNRPQQMVCTQYGKKALTKWKVLHRDKEHTRVIFKPITGRTHQLRVHAAHPNGLNTAILGDDLYGKIDQRLHLHAASITFRHPVTSEKITLSAPCAF